MGQKDGTLFQNTQNEKEAKKNIQTTINTSDWWFCLWSYQNIFIKNLVTIKFILGKTSLESFLMSNLLIFLAKSFLLRINAAEIHLVTLYLNFHCWSPHQIKGSIGPSGNMICMFKETLSHTFYSCNKLELLSSWKKFQSVTKKKQTKWKLWC